MNAEEVSGTERQSRVAVDFEASRAELDRLLGDPDFHCTDRNKSFLKFVAQALFKGRGESIKAYTVAVDVFGRPASFDPTTDPIVRIEATRLRACLSSYYDLHARQGSVRIDLPKGRYVPIFSRIATAAEADQALWVPAAPELLSPSQPPERLSRLYPSARMKWGGATAGIVGGVLLGAALLVGFLGPGVGPVVSEKPFVQLEMKFNGSPADLEAERLRDTLMVALSRFQTLRVMATDNDVQPGGAARRYRITMKYTGGWDRAVWWQVVDLASGEALRTDVEKTGTMTATSSDSVDALVNRLAVRFAGTKGLFSHLETAREIDNPTLGNGCILRASLAIDAADVPALKQAQGCIEQTLALRPSDADADAALSAVLLALDRPDAPTELTRRALSLADRAVALAPDSARVAVTKMMAEFRSGGIEAAIRSGRRAIELNPLNSAAKTKLGTVLFVSGQWEEGIALVMAGSAIEDDALPEAETMLAFDAYRRGDYEDALSRLERNAPSHCYCAQLLQVATLGQLGRSDDASQAMEALRRARPGFDKHFLPTMARWQFAPTLVASLRAGLEKAGLEIQ
jgi:tetratricopeptide (TPR) repeat protein